MRTRDLRLRLVELAAMFFGRGLRWLRQFFVGTYKHSTSFTRWLVWKCLHVDLEHDILIRTATGLAVVRFQQLGLDLDDNEIRLDLKKRRLRVADDEQLRAALDANPLRCPDGRLIALGGKQKTVLVFGKYGKRINEFVFPRDIKHEPKDFVLVVVL